MTDPTHEFRRSELVLTILALTTSLFLREWLRRDLIEGGIDTEFAKHLSFLYTLPTFFVIASPVLYRQRALLTRIWRWNPSTKNLIWRGVLIAVLCRMLWWALVTLRGTLGLGQSSGTFPDLLWTFSCPATGLLWISVLAMVVATPIVEELTHRGLIQTYFAKRGAIVGILASAFIFMLFHTPAVNPTVFFMGVVLGIQFYLTGSLWMPLATHATYNGLIQLDWYCLDLFWNPGPEQLPMWGVSAAVLASGITIICGLVWLLLGLTERR